MLGAGKPRGDDSTRGAVVARSPREVLARDPHPHVETQKAPRERAVGEDIGGQHLPAVRDGGALQMRVEAKRMQTVLRANPIHLAQHRSLVRRHAGVRHEWAPKQYESSKK